MIQCKLPLSTPALVAGSFVLAACLIAAPAFAVAVGEKAPGFELTDLEGETYSLSDYEGETVVLEWVNPNCPFSDRHAREATMIELADRYGEVVWLGINSTNPDHRDFLTTAQHQAWNDEHGVDYPILYDESGEVGHAYDAKTTPHMYIIDPEGTVVYNGAIDDDPPGRKAQDARNNYVRAGLSSLQGGSEPDPASTRPYGCTVKY